MCARISVVPPSATRVSEAQILPGLWRTLQKMPPQVFKFGFVFLTGFIPSIVISSPTIVIEISKNFDLDGESLMQAQSQRGK